MATITPTNQINAARMATNWGPGVTNNAQKWKNKTLAPRQFFNHDPVGAQANWSAGVNRALSAGTYASKIGSVDMNLMANAIDTYGAQNYGNSGTQKAAKYAAKTNALAAAETAVLATVISMPKGKGANNEQRMLAWSRGMAAYKGKI